MSKPIDNYSPEHVEINRGLSLSPSPLVINATSEDSSFDPEIVFEASARKRGPESDASSVDGRAHLKRQVGLPHRYRCDTTGSDNETPRPTPKSKSTRHRSEETSGEPVTKAQRSTQTEEHSEQSSPNRRTARDLSVQLKN